MTLTLRASTARPMGVSTVTSMPSWIGIASPAPVKGFQRTPKPRSSTMPGEAAAVQAKAIRTAAAASSHNVFRPDIFRVSEGYLN